LTRIARALPERFRAHNLGLLSAGVAFHAFLAFVPTLIVVVALYGRVADPNDVEHQVHSFARALPDEVERLITAQITRIERADTAGLSITLLVATVVALWSASSGMAGLIAGVNAARGRPAPSFVDKRGKALLLVLGAAVLLIVMMFLIAALPALLADLGWATEGRVALNVLRWPVLAFVMITAIGVLYRVAVQERRHRWLGVVTPGAVVATVVWLVASGLFALYTANFTRYSRTYGSIASIVVVLLWLYLSALAVLIGAEVDGTEQRTALVKEL
jgi:membrane protein